MSKTVDKTTRIATMENLTEHFLSQPYSGGNTPLEKRMRHEALKAKLVSCGDRFDGHDVMSLFYLLEERAIAEINKFAVLAQSTDPEAMLRYGLPKELVKNAKALKEHNSKQGKVKSAGEARAAKQAAKAKIAFQTWVKKTIDPNEHSGKIQIEDVRGMEGFEASWGQIDKTLKSWLKEVFRDFSFKRGARKK